MSTNRNEIMTRSHTRYQQLAAEEKSKKRKPTDAVDDSSTKKLRIKDRTKQISSSNDVEMKHATASNSYTLFQENKDIRPKLYAALQFVLNTCVLGASNRIADIVKTSGWIVNHF